MKRNFGLDLIRAISIWLVLLFHGGIDSDLFLPNGLGGYGVEVFFVLSGFLIGSILLKSLAKENSLKSIWQFWVRRWFRILPLYYLMVSLKFFFIGPEIGSNVIYYFLFLQNHFYGIGFYGVTWSLVIEEWFYLIAPIFLWLSLKFFIKEKTKLFIPIVGFIAGVILLRTYFVLALGRDFNAIYGSVPLRLDSIFIGVLLAFIKQYLKNLYIRISTRSFFSLAFVGLFVLILINGYSYNQNVTALMMLNLCIGTTFFSVMVALLIPYFENIKVDFWDKKLPYLRKFITLTSLLTYGIYLIHPIFLYSLRDNIFIFNSHLLNISVAILLSYIAAYLVYILFERPILMFRDKVTNRVIEAKKYLVN